MGKKTKEIFVEIPAYENGFQFLWEEGFLVETGVEEDKMMRKTITIKANKAGLISLAKQLLTLAEDDFSEGYHLHYDDSNSLEGESVDMIIEKV